MPPSTPTIVDTADSRRFGGFGPLQHVSAVHPLNGRSGGLRHGTVSFGQRVWGREKPWREWTVDVSEAAYAAAELVARGEAEDLYFSQQSFHGWRRIAQLRTLGALYQDLDYRTRSRHAGKPPEWVAQGVLAALDEEGIPAPSYIMSTGRGLCAIWLHDLLPRAALPRWQAVQARVAAVLTPFGADRMALDAARVFRVAGSVNSRADPLDAEVRMVWCHGDPVSPFRHVFDDLADQVLPHTRAEIRSIAAARAARRAERRQRTEAPRARLTVATWAETLLTDLQRLRGYRWPEGGIPSGQRDRWLFCAAVAMSWLAPPQVLERELASLAHEAAGWQGHQTRSRMSAAVGRAKAAAAGARLEWQGEHVDPRYRLKASTVVDWLEIDPAEQRGAGLRLLVDSALRRELATERARESRSRKGARSRADQQAARLAIGRRALWLAAKDGMTVREIAAELGISTGQVSKAMAEAAATR